MFRRINILLFCLFVWLGSSGQNQKKIDSLYNAAKKETVDTVRALLLNKAAKDFIWTDPKKALELLQEIKKNSKDSKRQKNFLAKNYSLFCSYYIDKSHYDLAALYIDTCLFIRKETGNEKGIVDAINWKGIIKWYTGDYNKALAYYMEALKLGEKIKDTAVYVKTLNNIGIVYHNLTRYDLSIAYYKKVIQYTDSARQPWQIASTNNNIGLVYIEMGRLDTALTYLQKSLSARLTLKYEREIATSYTNIGNVFFKKKDYNKALYFHEKAKALKRKINDLNGLVYCYKDIASVYIEQGQFDEAKNEQLTGLKIAQEINARDLIKDLYEGLSKSSYNLKNYKEAYDYYLSYSEIKDSMFSSENNMQITEMEAKYQNEKKEQENKLLKQENELQSLASEKKDSDLKKQKTIILVVSIGLLIVVVLAIFVLKGYREKQMANKIISEQKELVEDKQKEILDSIRYAKRIQQSLLPTEKFIERVLKNKS